MEQLFPLLIGLAVFAYKIYENFNKQKKEAEQRMRQQKRPVQQQHKPQPVPATPPHPPVVKKEKYSTMSHQKVVRESNEVPAEVLKLREERERLKSDKKIQVPIPVSASKEEKVVFDLRQAVIQQAILERPYQ
ncbi:hypothetical protein ACFU8T_15375 [Sphingobacterium spiritivorum]|uniref:Uncharacterized protein n=1 Tax=Sphingobacterium spiritivorum ATCC 33861 TaxID=525373 RepID=D7VJD3_SPHSI|nr:hypothetical protein [Sphingobacterium spiritivorum]EFK58986.1 hypothetical protein HMPREF0766_11102 [Sphingobacterium spiritivorum ATCC 33861]QQT36846.1 hypothetical protein I6J01_05310 [Sphingobacterium spiritivorum]WQD33604.1 hypothetical protein U0038_19020 [Sphingobacterium spiritivorum]SUJ25354.1 Uncharacterised protein [Sphingobacterium spiritivorum]